jgi:hypothetical protein
LDAASTLQALEEISPREQVEGTAALLDDPLPPGDDETGAEMRRQLVGRHNTVRPPLPLLDEPSALGTLKRLPSFSRRKGKPKPASPTSMASWPDRGPHK